MAGTLEDVAWDLEPLVDGEGEAGVDRLLKEAQDRSSTLAERYQGKVASIDGAQLAEAVAELQQISELVGKAGTYAMLRFATDTAAPANGALLQRVQEQATVVETRLVFFELEWAELDDARVDELLSADGLETARHHLRTIRRYRPHLLTEPEEKLMSEKGVTGRDAWSRLFSELTSAIEVTVDGETEALDVALAKLMSPDRELRERVQQAVTDALQPTLRTRAFIFNTLMADKSTDDRLRTYPSWISSRNLANEASDESVQALVDAVRGAYDIPQRWYRLKARLLGVERLKDYDRMAPVAGADEAFDWDQAKQIVLDSFGDFSPVMADGARQFFDENWIDAPPREGKRPGAFCATNVPDVHPYVFMNYTGERRSVLTLAHELGHGLHGYLAQPLGLFNASTPLTTAETASVFAEALTFKRLLALEEDPQRRLNLLAGRIEDSIATVYRQIAMNRFEDAVHTTRREEGELSAETFERLWLDSQNRLFGDSVDTDGYATWWSYVPHFIGTPGYVYAYSYGFLFALSIFRKYELEGEAIVGPYLDLLRSGGSKQPEELARMVGLDLTDRKIWDAGIDALASELDEAEALAEEIGLGSV
jgi:oligoendopeptidase F